MTKQEKLDSLLSEASHLAGEPVLPLSDVCAAFTRWFRCVEEANVTGRSDHGEAYYKHLRDIERDITKSDLLARLLYGKEKVRTVPCPLHKGCWSGIEWSFGDENNKCPHGCGLTGWLPEARD